MRSSSIRPSTIWHVEVFFKAGVLAELEERCGSLLFDVFSRF